MTMNSVDMDADSSADDVQTELAAFGLSEKEIEMYLSVLQHGEGAVSVVSEGTDVSTRYAYNVVETLEYRGLVQVNDHTTPTTVRARPPSEALEALATRLQDIAPALERHYNQREPQASQFEEIKSRQTALKRVREFLENAENEALIAIPATAFSHLESELRAVTSRGVTVLLLLGNEDARQSEAESRAHFSGHATVVRQWSENVPFLLAGDNQMAMMGDPDLLASSHGGERAMALNQEHLAGSIVSTFISGYWPVADEVFVVDPDPLPTTYGSFRPAVVQAALHQQQGHTLRATVETGSGRTLEGQITAIHQGLVEPRSNNYPIQNEFVLETDQSEVISVGGIGAFVEDYTASRIQLSAAE